MYDRFAGGLSGHLLFSTIQVFSHTNPPQKYGEKLLTCTFYLQQCATLLALPPHQQPYIQASYCDECFQGRITNSVMKTRIYLLYHSSCESRRHDTYKDKFESPYLSALLLYHHHERLCLISELSSLSCTVKTETS